MKKLVSISAFIFSVLSAFSQSFQTYEYPVSSVPNLLSDKYKVWVKDRNGHEKELQVLMSNAIFAGDFQANELQGRTFSFVHLSYDKTVSTPLSIRIEKLFGAGATTVTASPRSYNIQPTISNGGKTANFEVSDDSRYISINFLTSDNQTNTRKWIKHMICVFIDPKETDIPSRTGAGVVLYNDSLTAAQVRNASILYFPKGAHNLKKFRNGGSIDTSGIIILYDNQALYLEGGAFVQGLVKREKFGNVNQKIYGRGILSGRQYTWRATPGYTGIDYRQLVEMSSGSIKGVMLMESPNHGIVGNKVAIENLKFLGWHSNNDAVRVGSQSEISRSFIRAVDDHFYNFDIWVHDCVLWAGHNGAIMTYGWGGTATSNNYNSGSSLMENIDIIHPEWIGLGNNNGLIASQFGYDYKPFGYGGSTQTVMRNIRMEGTIPALTNLKPRSEASGNVAVQVDIAKVGYLGDLLLENITVDSQFTKGLIRGEANAAFNGNAKWYVQNVEFKNIRINNICITNANKNNYFTIDTATTRNLTFSGCTTGVIDKQGSINVEIFPNPTNNSFNIILPSKMDYAIIDIQGKIVEMGTIDGFKSVGQKLPKGVYLICFKDKTDCISKKIIKH
jgi:hypothetical protein